MFTYLTFKEAHFLESFKIWLFVQHFEHIKVINQIYLSSATAIDLFEKLLKDRYAVPIMTDVIVKYIQFNYILVAPKDEGIRSLDDWLFELRATKQFLKRIAGNTTAEESSTYEATSKLNGITINQFIYFDLSLSLVEMAREYNKTN